MLCNCESDLCGLHALAPCPRLSTTRCDWIGGVCDLCAQRMRLTGGAEYLGDRVGSVRIDQEFLRDLASRMARNVELEAGR